jgi:membrane-associated protease RseP (regulator of RpoE activity)
MREPRPGETPWEIITEVEAVEDPAEAMADSEEPRRLLLPIVLFLLTCASTYWVAWKDSHNIKYSLMYSGAVIFILTAHEMGHYVQTRRYGVPASLPYFIPMPVSIIGTMGAVIAMRGHMVLIEHYFGQLPPNTSIDLHPFAFAGWVGVLITSLNLFPIGQLDGGHILYGMLRERSWPISTFILLFAIGWTILTHNPTFTIMLFLLALVGPNHPPTADDNVSLGPGRIILGWLTLGFIVLGFTPRPLQF